MSVYYVVWSGRGGGMGGLVVDHRTQGGEMLPMLVSFSSERQGSGGTSSLIPRLFFSHME